MMELLSLAWSQGHCISFLTRWYNFPCSLASAPYPLSSAAQLDVCALWFHMWNPPITCRTGLPLAPHPAAVQHCGPYRAAPEQLVHTQKPRAPSLRSLLDSCPCLEPLAIFLSPQTLWFCVGYLRVNFPVQSVLMGRHNHSICDNVANKPCQLTKENFKHFLFSLANETA